MTDTALRDTLANGKWAGISQAGRIGLQLLSALILARLLAPEDYGLFAMVAVVVTLASMFRDLGTAQALIQASTLSDAVVLSIFWLNVAIGTAIAALVAALAIPTAALFGTPGLAPVLVLSALSLPLAAVGAVHQALLERSAQFKILARVEISAHALGLAVAVSLAATGHGVYSLAWQGIVTAAATAAQLWHASAWRPAALRLDRQALSLARFSGHLTGFSLVNYCARNADTFLIGRVLGAQALGVYSLAYKLMLFPLQNLSFVAGRALLPVMSRQQHDLPAMARLYVQMLRAVATLTAPLMTAVWVLRDDVVNLLFGPQWQAVAQVLWWLAPLGFLQSLMGTAGTVFMARGKTDWLLRIGLFTTATQLAAFVWGVRGGLHGLLLWYAVANAINAVPVLMLVCRLLGLSLGSLLKALAPAMLSALCMGAVLVLARNAVPADIAQLLKALAALLPALLTYGLVMRLVFKQSIPDLHHS